jgi:hypothetical protein
MSIKKRDTTNECKKNNKSPKGITVPYKSHARYKKDKRATKAPQKGFIHPPTCIGAIGGFGTLSYNECFTVKIRLGTPQSTRGSDSFVVAEIREEVTCYYSMDRS